MDKIEAMKRQIMGLGQTEMGVPDRPMLIRNPKNPSPMKIIAALRSALAVERKARIEAEARLKRVLDDIAKRGFGKPAPRLTIVKPISPSVEIEDEGVGVEESEEIES